MADLIDISPLREFQILRHLLETCAAAGVESVIAADHHGMIFLLSNGPEQIGGIVHRDDSLKYTGMKTLASEVNAALLPHVKDQTRHD